MSRSAANEIVWVVSVTWDGHGEELDSIGSGQKDAVDACRLTASRLHGICRDFQERTGGWMAGRVYLEKWIVDGECEGIVCKFRFSPAGWSEEV